MEVNRSFRADLLPKLYLNPKLVETIQVSLPNVVNATFKDSLRIFGNPNIRQEFPLGISVIKQQAQLVYN